MDQEVMSVNKREDWVDFTKAILIFLVIIGHVIQYFYCSGKDYWNNLIFLFIYSFHMPLFSLLSGYLFRLHGGKHGLIDSVKRRFMQIIVPCFAWASINYFLQVIIGRIDIISVSLGSFVKYWMNSNWFLWAMFYCACAMLICISMKDYRYVAMFAFIIINFVTPDWTNLIGYKMMLPFFVVGYIMHDFIEHLESPQIRTCDRQMYSVILGGGNSMFAFFEKNRCYGMGVLCIK